MNEIQRTLWDAMLSVEMNALYYGYIARRYERREKILQIAVAILATGSVGSLQLWKHQTGWFQWGWIWDLLSVIAVSVSVSLPFLNFSTVAHKASAFRPVFQSLTVDYENLWLQRISLTENVLRKRFNKTRKQETDQVATIGEATMPRDVKLIERCQDEISKSRGLR